MNEFWSSLERSVFSKATAFFRGIKNGVRDVEVRNTFGLLDGVPRTAIQGHEYRPQHIGSLVSHSHTAEDLQQMRREYKRLRWAMDAMPGGAPRTIEDMKELLPHVNPVGSNRNCIESSMAVDDIMRGRPAVAGHSGGPEGAWDYYVAPTPAAIELNMNFWNVRDARGVVVAVRPDGGSHMLNVRNFGGKIWWIDGQNNVVADSFDKLPYLDKFTTYLFYITGRGSL